MNTTNADAIRSGLIPCETNPDTGTLSRTADPFHALATYTVGRSKPRRHVCNGCRLKYHSIQPFAERIEF